MQLTKNRVGPDEWESWPPAARAAIERLEALLGATRTTLRVMSEELQTHADVISAHEQDIARESFKKLVKENCPLKPVEKTSVISVAPSIQKPAKPVETLQPITADWREL